MKNKKGQSIVEIIFSIGVIATVIVGVITLVVNVLRVKNTSLKRKQAAAASDIVLEDLLQEKKVSPENFWLLTPVSETPVDGFECYVYTVNFTEISGSGCRSDINDCANAVINIIWDNGASNLSVTRFFSRRG